MERQVASIGEPQSQPRRPEPDNGHGRTNGNGDRSYGNGRRTNGNGHGNGNGNTATDSQRRAIDAIARRMNADPALEAREVIGAVLDDLTLRQASALIDHLKSIQPANGNGRNIR